MFEEVNAPGSRPTQAVDPRQPVLPFPGWETELELCRTASAVPPSIDQIRSEAALDEQDEVIETDPETISTSLELADWKAELRRDFENWLDSLDSLPELQEESGAEAGAPDLYSFYEQLAVTNTEARKANRRIAEAFTQWGETLSDFASQLAPLREIAAQLATADPGKDSLPRAYCLVLVELLDRMYRLAQAFASPPRQKSWWAGRNADWPAAWEKQRQALAILLSHLEALLKKEGVTRLEVAGQPFDPNIMVAVAAEPDAQRSPETVLEELAAGYRHRGELLRAAQVKVSIRP